ncbi:MAG TPA: hypothetical protein PLC82_10490, partial [Smithellaceae bacterium]|nr:hypothetical protein [Smithellaceae bacterium]
MILHTSLKILLVIMVCLTVSVLSAVAEKPPQVQWQKICERVKNVSYPPADQPTVRNAKALKDCNSYNLYYGFYEEADPEKARLCAFGEMKDLGDSPFYGKAMLMTIYANGVGAK